MTNGIQQQSGNRRSGQTFTNAAYCSAAMTALVTRLLSAQPDRTQPGIERTPIIIPFLKPAPQPPGPLPPSCRVFLSKIRYAHWEVQSTQFAHEDTVRGQIQRIVDARATLLARPGLERVTLRQYADTGQAVGRLVLEQAHNGLPSGSYCLVTRYYPRVPAPHGEYDHLRWQMYLYRLDEPTRRAAAWVPFISRVDRKRDAMMHPSEVPRPYPPARFDFATDSELPANTTRYAVLPSLRSLYTPNNNFLAMTVWSTCVAGCCKGGVEALVRY